MTLPQQWQITIMDKPLKPRGKQVISAYVVAATSREEAVQAFKDEIGAHHLDLAERWWCASTGARTARTYI